MSADAARARADLWLAIAAFSTDDAEINDVDRALDAYAAALAAPVPATGESEIWTDPGNGVAYRVNDGEVEYHLPRGTGWVADLTFTAVRVVALADLFRRAALAAPVPADPRLPPRLAAYLRHDARCRHDESQGSGPCTCGLQDARAESAAPVPADGAGDALREARAEAFREAAQQVRQVAHDAPDLNLLARTIEDMARWSPAAPRAGATTPGGAE